MNQLSDQSQNDQGKSIAHELSGKESKPAGALKFSNDRPEAVEQRKLLQAISPNRPPVQMKPPAQRTYREEPAAPLAQKEEGAGTAEVFQLKENKTGLPDQLKSGVERLSGYSMDDVRVHFNSAKPAQLQALAYAQGSDIHLGPGQEQHLPHEAWHVVQQKQGRVQPTMQLKGTAVNTDDGLEREADLMGNEALKAGAGQMQQQALQQKSASPVLQRKVGFEFETGWEVRQGGNLLAKKTAIGSLGGNGWKVEADDGGRMEFIIHPPLQINNLLDARLGAIFDEIDQLCASLETQARNNRQAVEEEESESDQQQEVPPDEQQEVPQDDQQEVPQDDQQQAPDNANEDIVIPDVQGPDNQDELPADQQLQDDDDEVIDLAEYVYNAFALSTATNVPGDAVFMVTPSASGEIAGNPQITTGLALDQISKMDQQALPDESPLEYSIGGATNRMSALKVRVPANLNNYGRNSPTSEKLKGLLILIASYLQGGNQPAAFSYPKEIADSFMLSRTGFDRLYKLIPVDEKNHFDANVNQFVALCLHVANLADGAARVLTPGVLNAGVAQPFGPTRNAWLTGIVQGNDLMAQAQDPEYESMGELGNKVELVGTSLGILYEPGGIFEIRVGQTRSLEYGDWRAYALAVSAYLKSFQKDTGELFKDK